MTDDAIAVFHVAPARALAWVRRIYGRLLVGYLIFELAVVAVTLTTTPAAQRLSFWLPSAFVFAVFSLFMARSVAKSGRRLATFQLTLGPNVLRIVQQGLVATEVFRHDVTSIVELPSLLRITYGGGRIIGVPRTVDGYDDARARLATWHAITTRRQSAYNLALVLAVVGMFVSLWPLPSLILAVANLTWAGGLTFALWRVSRSALAKRGKAALYVLLGAQIIWALWRLHGVWS
jgi:hypothetical protein